MSQSSPTRRTHVRQRARAHYDQVTLYSIIDEALICHVGFIDDGQPFVLPTIHWRQDDHLYLHGSVATRSLRTAVTGAPLCITMTLVDGLVVARSAFHHSMNYRSAVVLGVAEEVTGDAKVHALEALVDKVIAGRNTGCRRASEPELTRTLVVRIPIDEASAKIRTGPPVDDDEDYGLDHWAGVIPLSLAAGAPEADPRLRAGIALPGHISNFQI